MVVEEKTISSPMKNRNQTESNKAVSCRYFSMEHMENIIDNWNPTHKEIREWALNPDSLHVQDWELAVAEFENFDLMIELANNSLLPKRKFFLGCLYVFVGDIVESKVLASKINLKNLIEGLKEEDLGLELKQWRERSLEIIADENLYNYDYWGLGSKYVYNDND